MASTQQLELLEATIAGFPEIARSLTAISSVDTQQSAEELRTLQAAVAGIPRVAHVLAAIPAKQRMRAYAAAEYGYLRTFHDLGFVDSVARRWAAIILRRLRTKVARQEAAMEKIAAALASSIHEAAGV
jgi:hypothetical protein